MPSKLFAYIWKLHPVILGLLLTFIPFICMLFYGMLVLYRVLAEKPEPNPNIMGIGVLVVVVLYLIWSKNVAVFFNKKLIKPSPISTKWYLRSFWYLVVYLFLETITKTSFVATDFKIDEISYVLLSVLVSFIRFLALAAYIYTNLFTARVVMSIEKKKEVAAVDALPYALSLWVFPIGIPILQYRLKKTSKNL